MNNLSEIHELLVILMEECGEVIQASSKVLRFGEQHNLDDLKKELGDVYAMMTLLERRGIISTTELEQRQQRKFEKLKIYSNISVDK